jgi:hypothetical protein
LPILSHAQNEKHPAISPRLASKYQSSDFIMDAPQPLVSFKSYSGDMTTATPVFACNLNAIAIADRPRYNAFVKNIRAAIGYHSEISGGCVFNVDGKTVTLLEAAEWAGMERLCCPFLTIKYEEAGDQCDWLLTITGPPGAKPLIVAEFPVPRVAGSDR